MRFYVKKKIQVKSHTFTHSLNVFFLQLHKRSSKRNNETYACIYAQHILNCRLSEEIIRWKLLLSRCKY